jgi:hypothetical protein
MKNKTTWMNDKRILLIIIIFLSLFLLTIESQAQVEKRLYKYTYIAHGKNAPLTGPISYSTIVSLNFNAGVHTIEYADSRKFVKLKQTKPAKTDQVEGELYIAVNATDSAGEFVYMAVFSDAVVLITDEDFVLLTDDPNIKTGTY